MTTRKPIRLDAVGQMPQEVTSELLMFNNVFAKIESIQRMLIENHTLSRIAANLDILCAQEWIIGYHYTRANHGDIASRGLQLSRGLHRRSGFLETHGHLFSAAQRERLLRIWQDYFDTTESRTRDGRLWFNFTLNALSNGGAHSLLTYFGGETIYMPAKQDEEIAAILRTIGQPLVVECELDPKKLRTFIPNPWGSIWISSYHRAVNPAAHQLELDGFVQEPISPDHVRSIHIASLCGYESWRMV